MWWRKDERLLSRMVRDEPRLGALAEEVGFFESSPAETIRVLEALDRVPNLKHVKDFLLPDEPVTVEHPSTTGTARPRLVSLSFDLHRTIPADGHELHSYFDLSALRSLDVNDSSLSSSRTLDSRTLRSA